MNLHRIGYALTEVQSHLYTLDDTDTKTTLLCLVRDLLRDVNVTIEDNQFRGAVAMSTLEETIRAIRSSARSVVELQDAVGIFNDQIMTALDQLLKHAEGLNEGRPPS